MQGINNSLAFLLRGYDEHKPALPHVRVTPPPVVNKVVGDPTRRPINRQASLIIAPVRQWQFQPLPPEKLPTPESKEIAALKAEVKAERNAHAATRDALGDVRILARQNSRRCVALESEILWLKAKLKEKDEIIKQLEDIKL